jgi:hypothetical protein
MKRLKPVLIPISARRAAQVFTILALCGAASRVYAIEDPGQRVLGMMGGGLGEVIRLNAVVPAATSDVNPGPCVVALGFTDSVGNPLGRPVAVNLAPGQSAFVEFDFSAMLSSFGQRMEVHPVVTPAYLGSSAGCHVSAEIYDRLSGRTSSYSRSFVQDPGRIVAVGAPVFVPATAS